MIKVQGQASLQPTAETMWQRCRECLKDTLSLLAYDRPEESPHGALMSDGARSELADALDEALLQQQGRAQQSGLEHILRSLVSSPHARYPWAVQSPTENLDSARDGATVTFMTYGTAGCWVSENGDLGLRFSVQVTTGGRQVRC